MPEPPFFDQFGFEFTSPCGEPNMNSDFDGELVISEVDVTGGATETLMVHESVELVSALGGSYHVELGRLIRYGCCETPWAVDFVMARL